MPGAAMLSPSRIITEVLELVGRRSEQGRETHVLLLGPPSGESIETFSAAGAHVTVEGEDRLTPPLAYPDESFDLILASDVLDMLDDDEARELSREWRRILRPGGRVFLLVRRGTGRTIPRFRLDVARDGRLRLTPVPGSSSASRPRSNREIDSLMRPMRVDEIYLRRDGLREVAVKRQPRPG
ncbi:MAG: class I SAM-dependent methyltransferase [Acidobacteriota bacterium]|nr:MAG: class I SAM-dependent methyltransferase [Acidobacteriota bacterium]